MNGLVLSLELETLLSLHSQLSVVSVVSSSQSHFHHQRLQVLMTETLTIVFRKTRTRIAVPDNKIRCGSVVSLQVTRRQVLTPHLLQQTTLSV